MTRRETWVCALLAMTLISAPATRTDAATAAERRAFAGALRWFDGGLWAQADIALAEFAQKYPKSDLVEEAVLRRAQARLRMSDAAGAFALLSTNLGRASKLADQYLFYLGEAAWASTNFTSAAEAYSRLWSEYPGSPLAARAGLNHALALAALARWAEIPPVLTNQTSPIASMMALAPADPLAVEAALLLADAYLNLRAVEPAERVLARLESLQLDNCTRWRVRYLTSRLEFEAGRLTNVVAGFSNLTATAQACARQDYIAETITWRAKTWISLGDTNAALTELRALLQPGMPEQHRKWALVRSVELWLDSGALDEASTTLAAYGRDNAGQAPADAALLAAAEIHLYRAETTLTPRAEQPGQAEPEISARPPTNEVYLAVADCDVLISNHPTSPFLGKALLVKGWALAVAGNLSNSMVALQAAVPRLDSPRDRALATFKLADVRLAQGDVSGALSNYLEVVSYQEPGPGATNNLHTRALYQVVVCASRSGLQSAAEDALRKILELDPHGATAQTALFYFGINAMHTGRYTNAVHAFAEFCTRFPDSELVPRAQFMMARLLHANGDLPGSLALYERLVTNSQAGPILPMIQYNRALALHSAGDQSNAAAIMHQLTTLTNGLAASAQFWLGDYYFARGDYSRAEENYQLVFQRWPRSELAARARMNAGRAAVARLGFNDATAYFLAVANDQTSPPEMVAEALFAYGDALARAPATDPTRPLANFEEAIRAFGKLQQLYPTNELAVRAAGRIGDCYLQLAAQNPNFYESAARAYASVLTNSLATVPVRSQAEVGLGLVLEKQAALKPGTNAPALAQQALTHYMRVVYGENLAPGEQPNPFWVKEAAQRAFRLMEELQMLEQQQRLVEYLRNRLPGVARSLETRMDKKPPTAGKTNTP